MKTHFEVNRGNVLIIGGPTDAKVTACTMLSIWLGEAYKYKTTRSVQNVTCLNCQRSRAYIKAARGATFNENDPAVKAGKNDND